MDKRWQPDRKLPGLGLMVLPSGVKTWYLRYREPGGKQQTHRIGRAEVVSLTMAREEAHRLLASVSRGEAPTSARKERRAAPTLADLAARLAREHYGKLRPSTASRYELLWRLHILPALGGVKVPELQARQVLRWLDAIESTITHNRALGVLKHAMGMAELWQLRPQHSNPCHRIPMRTERLRKRYLTRAEMAQLVAALDAYAITTDRWRYAQLVRLLMFTGARLREIMCARFEWIDWEAGLMRVPATMHKTGRAGHDRVIHLAPPALSVAQALRARTNTGWLIQGAGDGPLVGYRKQWLDILREAGIEDLRIHDLRHHHASMAISAGLSLPMVGALLGHQSSQTTQRYAHLIDEAAAAAAAKVAAAWQ